MMQQREFGTLFQNEKSEKYKNEILNSTEKKNIAISKDNPLLISADLLEKVYFIMLYFNKKILGYTLNHFLDLKQIS